jgi:hypothetical protein
VRVGPRPEHVHQLLWTHGDDGSGWGPSGDGSSVDDERGCGTVTSPVLSAALCPRPCGVHSWELAGPSDSGRPAQRASAPGGTGCSGRCGPAGRSISAIPGMKILPYWHICCWPGHGFLRSGAEAGFCCISAPYVPPAMDSCLPTGLHSDPFITHSSCVGSFAICVAISGLSECDSFGE